MRSQMPASDRSTEFDQQPTCPGLSRVLLGCHKRTLLDKQSRATHTLYQDRLERCVDA